MKTLLIVLCVLAFVSLILNGIMEIAKNVALGKIYDDNLMLTYSQIRKYHHKIEVCEKIKFTSSIVLFFVFLGIVLLLVM